MRAARRRAPIDVEVACGELPAQRVSQVGIAAHHDPGSPRIEAHARRGLQAALLDKLRNSGIQCPKAGFAGDNGQVLQSLRVDCYRFLVRNGCDLIKVSEFTGMADAVRDDDCPEGGPGRRIAKNRDKRAKPGAARQEPEILARREIIDSEEAVAGLVHTHWISLADYP